MKLKDFIIIALLLVLIYFWQCRKAPVKVETKTVRTTDTIYKSDTIVKTITKRYEKLTPVHIIYDTASNWSKYLYEINDSLLTARITAEAETRPKIAFEYKLRNFTIRDTITIKDSVYQEATIKNALFWGAEISGNAKQFGFSPSLTFAHKSGINYSIRYDLINKMVGVKFERKF